MSEQHAQRRNLAVHQTRVEQNKQPRDHQSGMLLLHHQATLN